jgi:hypothetical protein
MSSVMKKMKFGLFVVPAEGCSIAETSTLHARSDNIAQNASADWNEDWPAINFRKINFGLGDKICLFASIGH